jgi:hypothetical protein
VLIVELRVELLKIVASHAAADHLTIASYAVCDLAQPFRFRSVSLITDTTRLCKIKLLAWTMRTSTEEILALIRS